MLKKINIFFFLFFLNFNFVLAETGPYCNGEISESLLKSEDSAQPKLIKVTPNKNRQWQKNNIRIITENARIIPLKFKQRFDATIDVIFAGNIKCSFYGRVRQHGDFKDHIYLKDGSIIQSLDIHLRTGHINGVTKFKLLIPNTRGNADHEIFLTELLRELNFLAPRSGYVNVKINGKKTTMLFQEKAAKELLESNLRREGPILEGDERYMMPSLVKFPDNQLSNMGVGMLQEIEKGVAIQLAKQTNTNWISKTDNHLKISFHSLTLLNRAYLLYGNQFKSLKNDFLYFNYNLDNNLLGLNDAEHILKLDVFNSIVFAANGWHGLVPANRKFYWNSLENYFEPIYYDGNVNIDEDPLYINLPYSDFLPKAIATADKMLDQIQVSDFMRKLNYQGLNYSKIETEKVLDKLRLNLKKLTYKISQIDAQLVRDNNNIKITDTMWSNYINLILNFNSKTNLTLKNVDNQYFTVCNGKPLVCSLKKFSITEIENLLESRLSSNESVYQYIGEYEGVDFLNEAKQTYYEKIKFQDSNFYFDKNIEFAFDSKKKEFNIFQNKPGARAFFYKGTLKDIGINFYGYDKQLVKEIPNYPVDQRGLTGCLSLILLNAENIKISSNNSSCEDGVNLVNVEGSFSEIIIKDSFSDGLDVDFSKVEIDKIDIFSSKNDCVDFSAGNYKLNKLYLVNCGDKALSVGEKSFLQLDKIVVENSDIGIASKDSSVTKLKDAYLKDLKTCVSAYNKKQEFYGGFLEAQNIECENYVYKVDTDINSKIIIENEL